MPAALRLCPFVLAALCHLHDPLLAQEPTAPPVSELTPAALIARYQQLGAAQRAEVVRNMERRLLRTDNETLQHIQGCQRGKAAYPLASPPSWFSPRDFAPSAAPRHLVGAGSDEHRYATRGMHPFECLNDLRASVYYDWQSGKAVRRDSELGDDERFANYANGFAPGSDHAVAQVLEALDNLAAQRRLGSFFEHVYADRNGAVFAGICIFDAWNSGTRIEMPDTDAIAYARLVLQTQSFVAPLADDRRRDRLYERMRDGFAAHREHRTLLLAIAAALVAAEPRFGANYQSLIDRGHWLWQKHALDTQRVVAFVAKTPERTALLDQIDAAMATEGDLVSARRRSLQELANYLRELADQELRAANG